MRKLAVSMLTMTLMSSAAAAQESPDKYQETWGGVGGELQRLEPVTKNWTSLKEQATSSQIADELAGVGWSKEEVSKKLDPKVKYDLLKLALLPGQVAFMAVPTGEGVKMDAVQFGVPGFGLIGSGAVPATFIGDAFEEIKAEAVANLRSALAAACSLPGRPTSLRLEVTVKVLTIEATWETAEVCAAGGVAPQP